jgi:hypothetical protein
MEYTILIVLPGFYRQYFVCAGAIEFLGFGLGLVDNCSIERYNTSLG